MAEGPGRQRLDPAARKRLLAEIARLDAAVRAGGAAADATTATPAAPVVAAPPPPSAPVTETAAPAQVPPPDDGPAPATGPQRIKLRPPVATQTGTPTRSATTAPQADRLPRPTAAPLPSAVTPIPTTAARLDVALPPASPPLPVTATLPSSAAPQPVGPFPPVPATMVDAPAPPLTLQPDWVPDQPSETPPADEPPPDLTLGWIPLDPLPLASLPAHPEPDLVPPLRTTEHIVTMPDPMPNAARPAALPLAPSIPAPAAGNIGPIVAPTVPPAPPDGTAPPSPTSPRRTVAPLGTPGPAVTRPAASPDNGTLSAAADGDPGLTPNPLAAPQDAHPHLTSLPPQPTTARPTAPRPAATTAAAPLNSTPQRAPVMPPRPRRPPAQRVMVTPTPAPDAAPPTQADPWAALATVPVHSSLLDRNLIITAARRDPAHGAFDVLRTRMLQALQDNGWSRVGVTSPTKGCGKTFTALNLAVTLSRYGNARTVLLDLDLRLPSLATTLGVEAPGPIGDMLRGQIAPALHLRRFGANGLNIGDHLALGLNALAEPYPAELLHHDSTAAALAAIREQFRPDVMLFDLPPVLMQDDVLALAPQLDAVLIVAGGGRTSARDVREAQRRLGDQLPVLGIVLNMAEGDGTRDYSY